MNERKLRLRSLQVYNFGYAPYQEPLPIGDLTLLLGRNGSGKTTMLNAIQLILGARHVSGIDRFIFPGCNWAFVKVLADNVADERGRRPFDQVFDRTLAGDDCVTLACLLERKGSWEKSYFIVPGDEFEPAPGRKPDPRFTFKQEQYRSNLARLGVQDALLNLLEMGLGSMPDDLRYPDRRFQFFFRLVGDEEIQHRYQEARRQWWEQRDRTDDLAGQLRREEVRLAEWEVMVRAVQRGRELERSIERNSLLARHATMRDLEHDKERFEQQEASFERQLAETTRDLTSTRAEHAGFEADYEAWHAEYDAWRRQRGEAEATHREAAALESVARRDHDQQGVLVQAIEGLEPIPLDEAQHALREADAAWAAASARLATLDNLVGELQRDGERLRRDETPLRDDVARFLDGLRARDIDFVMVAHAVEVTDPVWLNAFEGALGAERYTVVVADRGQRIAAKELAERLRYRFYISPPNGRTATTSDRQSLWHIADVSDARVRGWVFERTAHIRRVADVREGDRLAGEGIVNITRDAYLQERRGGRSVWTDELVCGRNARLARLRQVEERLATLATERKAAEVEEGKAAADRRAAAERVRQAETIARLSVERLRLEELTAKLAKATARLQETQAWHALLARQEDNWNARREELAGRRSKLEGRIGSAEADLDRLRSELGRAGQGVIDSEVRMRELRETPPGLLELEPDLAATFESESLGPEVYRQRAARSRQELSELTLPEHEINEELYERQRQTVQRMMDEVEQMRGRAQEYRGLFETALAEFRRHVEYLFNVAIARHFREYCRAARARASLEVSGDDQDHWVMLVRVGYNDKDPEPLETARLSQGEKVVTGLFIVLAALRAVDAAPLLVLDEFLGTLDDVNATLVFQRLREAGAQSFIASPHVRPRVYALADTLWQFSPRREGEPLAPPVAAEDRRRPVAL